MVSPFLIRKRSALRICSRLKAITPRFVGTIDDGSAHRTFDEVGVAIEGVDYGHFTGELQFDPDGSVALMDIERSGFQGPPLRLDLDTLLIERSRLRNKYGIAFMTDYPGDDVHSHRRRFELYRALAETL
jgi:hypothetical protein